jgi:hypothetical protein
MARIRSQPRRISLAYRIHVVRVGPGLQQEPHDLEVSAVTQLLQRRLPRLMEEESLQGG